MVQRASGFGVCLLQSVPTIPLMGRLGPVGGDGAGGVGRLGMEFVENWLRASGGGGIGLGGLGASKERAADEAGN